MKKLFKAIICIIIGVYILALSDQQGNALAAIFVMLGALDRFAAWADRNVPDSDPRKHV
jgi:hypothetical protein